MKWLDRIAGWFAAFGAAGFLLLAVILIFDAILGRVGLHPVAGLNEIVAVLISAGVSACLPAGLSRRVHLKVDVLARWIPLRAANGLRRLGDCVLLAFVLALAIGFARYAWTVFERGQITAIMGVPLCYLYGVVAFNLAVGTLTQLAVMLTPFATESAPKKPLRLLGQVMQVLATVAIVALFVLFATGQAVLPASNGMLVGISLAVTWILILAGAPVGAVLGLAGLCGAAALIGPKAATFVLGLELTPYLENEQFAVLPLFLLMGSLAAASGLATDVYCLANLIFGRLRGGLAIGTILGCAGFGAVTGSSVATLATLGRVALPQMRRAGYHDKLSTGALAAGGTLGMLIPPSSILILYALLTEVSIGRMFLAAIVPALLSVGIYALVILTIVRLKPDLAPPAAAIPDQGVGLRQAAVGVAFVLALGTAIVAGLYGGFFTLLQTAALGVIGVFLLAAARGALSGGKLREVMSETVASTAMIYLLVFGGITFSYFIGLSDIVQDLADAVAALHPARLQLILALVAIYIVLGTVIDPVASLVITVPVVAPLLIAQGIDLAWWGVVVIVLVEAGMLHPPMGINVFILKGIAGEDVPLSTVFKGVLPFVAADMAKLALLIAFPVIALWLPGG